jgi:hypothetical protein
MNMLGASDGLFAPGDIGSGRHEGGRAQLKQRAAVVSRVPSAGVRPAVVRATLLREDTVEESWARNVNLRPSAPRRAHPPRRLRLSASESSR